ncbi:hypothetical protein KSS87_003840 [Heliosperma pusillum]|nr:hypothetical protein KSS87_003840 [Heliosperma pusillum]
MVGLDATSTMERDGERARKEGSPPPTKRDQTGRSVFRYRFVHPTPFISLLLLTIHLINLSRYEDTLLILMLFDISDFMRNGVDFGIADLPLTAAVRLILGQQLWYGLETPTKSGVFRYRFVHPTPFISLLLLTTHLINLSRYEDTLLILMLFDISDFMRLGTESLLQIAMPAKNADGLPKLEYPNRELVAGDLCWFMRCEQVYAFFISQIEGGWPTEFSVLKHGISRCVHDVRLIGFIGLAKLKYSNVESIVVEFMRNFGFVKDCKSGVNNVHDSVAGREARGPSKLTHGQKIGIDVELRIMEIRQARVDFKCFEDQISIFYQYPAADVDDLVKLIFPPLSPFSSIKLVD